jgi:hypothetical protein
MDAYVAAIKEPTVDDIKILIDFSPRAYRDLGTNSKCRETDLYALVADPTHGKIPDNMTKKEIDDFLAAAEARHPQPVLNSSFVRLFRGFSIHASAAIADYFQSKALRKFPTLVCEHPDLITPALMADAFAAASEQHSVNKLVNSMLSPGLQRYSAAAIRVAISAIKASGQVDWNSWYLKGAFERAALR